jgi:hypothetical protein
MYHQNSSKKKIFINKKLNIISDIDKILFDLNDNYDIKSANIKMK